MSIYTVLATEQGKHCLLQFDIAVLKHHFPDCLLLDRLNGESLVRIDQSEASDLLHRLEELDEVSKGEMVERLITFLKD